MMKPEVSTFDLLEDLVIALERAGARVLALELRANYARDTGGVDAGRIVEALVGAITSPARPFSPSRIGEG